MIDLHKEQECEKKASLRRTVMIAKAFIACCRKLQPRNQSYKEEDDD